MSPRIIKEEHLSALPVGLPGVDEDERDVQERILAVLTAISKSLYELTKIKNDTDLSGVESSIKSLAASVQTAVDKVVETRPVQKEAKEWVFTVDRNISGLIDTITAKRK